MNYINEQLLEEAYEHEYDYEMRIAGEAIQASVDRTPVPDPVEEGDDLPYHFVPEDQVRWGSGDTDND